MNFSRTALVCSIPFVLTACGDSTGPPNDNLEPGAGGLHFGFYAEDPINNPEDPVPGALYLGIPDGDGDFRGTLSFTYLGCQSTSVGTVGGQRLGPLLSGEWTGTVDGTSQSGTWAGARDEESGFWTGTYTVDSGKQFIEVPDCEEYFIAAYGSWMLFPPGTTFSETGSNVQDVNIAGGVVTWADVPNTLMSLVSVVDVAYASDGDDRAIPWQTLVPGGTSSVAVPTGTLVGGREYVLSAVAIGGGGPGVLYHSNRSVVIP